MVIQKLPQVATNSRSLEPDHTEKENAVNLAAVPPVQQVKQTKEQNINNLEKKKYSHQLNRSPTKSPTGKQNDDSDGSLQIKSIKSRTLLDDISQDDRYISRPNITDALA